MNNLPGKICFLADSHGLFDDRIYWKEAVSLKKLGYEVYYIMADWENKRGTTNEGIHYIKVKREKYSENRYINYLIKRIIPGGLYKRMVKKAAELRADVYHFHDLKLNRIGPKLKKLPWNPKVIYDVHEPYPENIRDYHQTKGIYTFLKNSYSNYIQWWERSCAKNYDLIIVTEDNLQKRFQEYFPKKPVEIIYNYTNLEAETKSEVDKEFDAIYTGGITKLRGAWKILEALKIASNENRGIKVLFLGTWFPEKLKTEMKDYIAENRLSDNVILKDNVPYNEVAGYYRKSKVGFGIFLPNDTHRIILQIKIFEYMNFGLPIIGSNFGHINKIIQKHNCGVSVDPEKPKEIAGALVDLLDDSLKYKQMSENGKSAVKQFYRWALMEEKLKKVYSDLLNQSNNGIPG
ncbi:MAG: glycosyltransferase family 4 protein [Bacteroidales bacterium]